MARITKDPEIRRQEILDTAIQLFYEKGYEKTSMNDIAQRMNVSQGLCYRYFQSKEEIFDFALDYYTNIGVEKFSTLLCDDSKTIKQKLKEFPTIVAQEQKNDVYTSFYHKNENKMMHSQVLLKLCEKLSPIVFHELDKAKAKGEIDIDNSVSIAYFCMYGQLGILMCDELSYEEKIEQTQQLISSILNF